MARILIKNVVKQLNGRILFTADNLQVDNSGVVGIIGNNGGGKSTLIKMIAGIDHDYEGTIQVDGSLEYVQQINPHADRSGGQTEIRQIQLALRQRPEILILDEPTSNLDENHQNWLIKQINQFRGIVLLISHDRETLAKCANTIWALSNGKFEQFNQSFADYELGQQQRFERQTAEYERSNREKKDLAKAAQKRMDKAAHVRKGSKNMGRIERAQTKSIREQTAGKLEATAQRVNARAARQPEVEKPFQQKNLKLMATSFPKFLGKTVLSINGLDLTNGSQQLLTNVQMTLHPGDRLAIDGANGTGKTTLINAIVDQKNGISISNSTELGYFAQDISQMPEQQTVWDYIREDSQLKNDQIRQIMGAFGISADFYQRQLHVLSGGERDKVQLLRIILGNYNLLILDEPTNFLDMSAVTGLADYLTQYPGTVLFVSHDRQFNEQVATRRLEIRDHKLIDPSLQVEQKFDAGNLTLLQLRYDQLIMDPTSSTEDLINLKKQIEAIKKGI